ncbi:UNVERIFIED_CONTAM: Translation factor GUF1-like protein [Trichonephila clavipes]
MPFKRRRNHFQWRTEFERGSVIVLREGGFSFCDNAERLARNVSTGSNGQGMVLPQEDGVPSGHVALLRRKTAVFNVRLWRIVRRLRLQFSNEQKGIKINMRKIPLKNIRNFGIIAHVDHGKSTLSDRLMEFAGNISKKNKNEQVLDKLQVERERGITVKAQTVSLFHEYGQEMYLLNLIDTPGVQAQTVANFNLASTHGLKIIPVLNKIDLKNAKPDIVSNQLTSLFGFDKKEILKVSAKLGTGIEDVIVSVIEKIPPPNGNVNQQFRALQYDSWFTQYHGVICLILIVDGSIQVGEEITSASSGCSYIIKELGILYPEEIPVKELFAGQAGYFRANIKNPKDAKVGDTWFKKGTTVEPLPLIAQSKPMVFAGIFPSDQSKTQDLRKAIEKLILNDSSVSVSLDTSHGYCSFEVCLIQYAYDSTPTNF